MRVARETPATTPWVTSHGRDNSRRWPPVDVAITITAPRRGNHYDGGVMRGVDVVKAIARGATAVGMGVLYGLAGGGVRGVEPCS